MFLSDLESILIHLSPHILSVLLGDSTILLMLSLTISLFLCPSSREMTYTVNGMSTSWSHILFSVCFSCFLFPGEGKCYSPGPRSELWLRLEHSDPAPGPRRRDLHQAGWWQSSWRKHQQIQYLCRLHPLLRLAETILRFVISSKGLQWHGFNGFKGDRASLLILLKIFSGSLNTYSVLHKYSPHQTLPPP